MKIVLFANTDWYLYNYRLKLAEKLQSSNHKVLFLSPMGDYVEKIRQAGFNWIAFPLSRRGMNPFVEVRTIFRLVKRYRQEEPDVVHHFTIKCVLYGSIAAKLAHVPGIVNSITGKGILFSQHSFLNILIRPIIRFVYKICLKDTKVIFQNQSDLVYFQNKKLIQPDHATLIPGSGVDLARFKQTLFPEGTPLVILPARMLWSKGVSEFVEAAAIIAGSGRKIRFVLVGKPDVGNPDSIPLRKLKEWQKKGVVEWWGWRQDMPEVYQAASIVCLPSYYGEGLSKSLIEAAASGRPLIATDMPGCREVINNGVNGLLIQPNNAHQLADVILELVSDRKKMIEMGDESRKLAESLFSSKVIIEQTENIYNHLL